MQGSNIYADESCQNAHRFMVLGGVIVEIKHLGQVKAALQQVRDSHKIYGEMKWEKVSRSKFSAYRDYVDVFFEQAANDVIHFHSVTFDTRRVRHSIYNLGDEDAGFNKFVYQLLFKFGRIYSPSSPYYCYLHQRCTRQNPETLKDILNAGIASRLGVTHNPFRRVQFKDSASVELLQLNDILLGAVATRWNGHHLRLGASQSRAALGEYILRRAGIAELTQGTPRSEYRFTTWPFRLR